MKIVVLDAKTFGMDLDLSIFGEVGEPEIYTETKPDEVSERIRDAEVVVLNKIKLNETNLFHAEKLKLICVTATGYDNIDIDYCRKKFIAVCNVRGYSTQSVAQVTLAMALSLCTSLPQYSEYVKSGLYTQNKAANHLEPVFHEIFGKVWGIVGLGNIGRQVALAARAMGCRVIAYKRMPEDGFDCVDLETLCRESDIISVHLPLCEETRNIINKEKIAMMKKTAIFINVARGSVADEKALALAIEHNRLGGLGIDVYETEPFDEEHPYNRILNNPNVCLTPHMAWGAYEARVRCIREVCENIAAFYDGKIRNRVD
ncbi:MAG: hydroxyacid dehydrogenase [Clostridia bacterium]|nr:hydroxyacid dehydrogenase [Clostridia bacterium]